MNMKEKHNGKHDFEQLLLNCSFRNWVFDKCTKDEASYWETWESENEINKKQSNDAKALLFTFLLSYDELSDEEIDIEINKIIRKIRVTAEPISARIFNLFRFTLSGNRQIAFGVVICFVLASLYVVFKSQVAENNNYDSLYTKLLLSDKKNVFQCSNYSDSSKRFILPDGSTTVLSRNTKLSFFYRADSGFLRRELILSGEAFFDVVKNPKQPFIVYTNSLVTKVLGTTFTISAYPHKGGSVKLHSGKVSVYKNSEIENSYKKPEFWGGVILMPNQNVFYDDETKTLEKSLSENPSILSEYSNADLNFTNTPIYTVFDSLGKVYSINIIYDKNLFSGNSLTVSFGKESFYKKIEIICKSTNSKYEIVDGNVIISKGF